MKNGLLFRWYNHLKCGAVYGHKWRKDAEDNCGHTACTCIVCGKQKVF